MTKRGGAVIFCRILAPPQWSSSPDATILIYFNDRETVRAPLSFLGFWRPPNALPPPQTPQYLKILMTERGAIMFVGF